MFWKFQEYFTFSTRNVQNDWIISQTCIETWNHPCTTVSPLNWVSPPFLPHSILLVKNQTETPWNIQWITWKRPRNRITFDTDCHIHVFLQLHIVIHKARDHISSVPSLKLHHSHTHHLQQSWLKNHNAILGLPKGPSPRTISYSEMVPEISCNFHGAGTFCWDATSIIHLNESNVRPSHFVPQAQV